MRTRPAAAELRAAQGRRLRDVLAPGLDVVFCGINPGLYSAAVGHHFARPGNRFWQALADAGFTDRLLAPAEDRALLRYGCGLTNLVARATASADELSPEELVAGGRRLAAKIRRTRPRCVAFLGLGAYRLAFGDRKAGLGAQPIALAGARLWVLPNPSGRTAAYQRPDFARLFRALRADLPGSQRAVTAAAGFRSAAPSPARRHRGRPPARHRRDRSAPGS
jgi:TDG/mug DNA glycosylase family protein